MDQIICTALGSSNIRILTCKYITMELTDYLGIPCANGALMTVVDVHSSRVLIFQRGTNYDIIEAIHVDI